MDTTIRPFAHTPEAQAEDLEHDRNMSPRRQERHSSAKGPLATAEERCSGNIPTDRKKELQRVCAEREARYRQIVEDETDPVCRFLPDGTLTFVNGAPCNFLARIVNESIGTSLFDIMSGQTGIDVRRRITCLQPTAPVFKHEYQITTAPKDT